MKKEVKKTAVKNGDAKIKIIALVIAGVLLFGTVATVIGVLLSI